MKNNPLPGFESVDAEIIFKEKRLLQVFWAVELCLAGMIIHQAFFAQLVVAGLVACIAASLFSTYFLARKGQVDSAALVLFIILSVSVTCLMWRFQGLRDESILAFPAILMFCAILGNSRIFFVLLTYMIAVVLFIGYAGSAGWHVSTVNSASLTSAITIAFILLVTSFSVWMIANDLRSVLRQLAQENIRVRESQEKIQRLVHHDVLTNLPNRVLARDRFEHALSKSQREASRVCLMFLDLDNFKDINDSLGHQSGDYFLVELANRLSDCVRKSDTICRQGGDEFLIILESVSSEDQIAQLALEILEKIKKPIMLDDAQVVATVSIGIAVAPYDGSDFETICKKADLAMYHAKEMGRNGYRFYDEEMNVHAQEKLHLITELRTAIQDSQFSLYYQPKVDLKSGAIVGAEALIRWQHPDKGLILPLDFIPHAERSGLIIEIGEWVAMEACRECKKWNDMGFDDLSVAINVSSIQFKRGNIALVMLKALESSQLQPSNLELELTESLLIDDSQSLKDMLTELRKIGVVFAIDDFGTGYSNLGYLKKFDVETLKIDQSFVRRIVDDPQDKAIVKAIIQVSSSLNLKTVAEGVEVEQVAEHLRGLNCDLAQGYLWAKPLPADAFIEFLQDATRASEEGCQNKGTTS